MATKVLTIPCDIVGAVMLLDPIFADQFNEQSLYALMVAFDPDGESELVCDFPGEDWSTVWKRGGAPIWTMCNTRRLFVDVIPGGEFVVLITDDEFKVSENRVIASTDKGIIQVIGGTIAILEADELVGHGTFDRNLDSYHEFDVPPGTYNIQVFHLSTATVIPSVEHLDMDENSPAIVFQLSAYNGEAPPVEEDTIENYSRFPRHVIENMVQEGRICKAVVHRVESERAILSILISPNVMSGYAQVPTGEHHLAVGQRVRIKLIEKRGGRWRAELLQ